MAPSTDDPSENRHVREMAYVRCRSVSPSPRQVVEGHKLLEAVYVLRHATVYAVRRVTGQPSTTRMINHQAFGMHGRKTRVGRSGYCIVTPGEGRHAARYEAPPPGHLTIFNYGSY